MIMSGGFEVVGDVMIGVVIVWVVELVYGEVLGYSEVCFNCGVILIGLYCVVCG